MSVTSISLTPTLLHKLDEIKDEKGYSSRSEVIRDAIRSYLSDYEISKFDNGKNLTATITAIYQKNGPHLDDVLLHLRHEYDDIADNIVIHISNGFCV
jgi:CopG family nickel-responsive transcriptional regulator